MTEISKVTFICECIVSISLAEDQGKYIDETCTLKKDYNLRRSCEVYNPDWAIVTDFSRGDQHLCIYDDVNDDLEVAGFDLYTTRTVATM